MVLSAALPAAPDTFPTGSITSGTDQLTVGENLSAYVDDYVVIVEGAGTSGENLVTYIESATATIATLAHDAETTVADADVTLLSIADGWVLDIKSNGRMEQRLDDEGDPVVYPITNRFQSVSHALNALLGVEKFGDEWQPYKWGSGAIDLPWIGGS